MKTHRHAYTQRGVRRPHTPTQTDKGDKKAVTPAKKCTHRRDAREQDKKKKTRINICCVFRSQDTPHAHQKVNTTLAFHRAYTVAYAYYPWLWPVPRKTNHGTVDTGRGCREQHSFCTCTRAKMIILYMFSRCPVYLCRTWPPLQNFMRCTIDVTFETYFQE